MPEPANSDMAEALELTQKVGFEEKKLSPQETAPDQDKEDAKLPRFDRINERGEVEDWRFKEGVLKNGSKVYFLKKRGSDRFAILGDAEYKAEQDMVEKGKKFKEEKTWVAFVSVLEDAKEKDKNGEQTMSPVQKYLIGNRGRILEDAILSAEIENLTPEEALKQAIDRALSMKLEVGYKDVAKSLEFFANDYILNNSAQGRTPAEQKTFIAEQKKAAERARLADLASFAYGMGSMLKGGNLEGENTESLGDAYDNLKTRRNLVRDYYGTEETRSVTRGEVKKADFHAPSVAYAEKELAKKRREAVIALQEGKVSERRAPVLVAQLLSEMNELRVTVGREAVENPEDMPQEWRYLWKLAQDVNATEATNQKSAPEAPKGELVTLMPREVPPMPMPAPDDILQARAKKIRARRAEAEKVFAEGQMSPARRIDLAPANLPVEDEVMTNMQQAVERIVAPVREKTPPKKVVMRKYTPPAEAAPAPIAAAPLANEAEFELMNKKEIKAVKAPRNFKEQMAAAPEVQAEVQGEALKKAKREKTAPLAEAPTVPSVPRRSSGSFSEATVVREVPKPKASVLSRMWNFFWGAPAKIQEAAAVAQENAGL